MNPQTKRSKSLRQDGLKWLDVAFGRAAQGEWLGPKKSLNRLEKLRVLAALTRVTKEMVDERHALSPDSAKSEFFAIDLGQLRVLVWERADGLVPIASFRQGDRDGERRAMTKARLVKSRLEAGSEVQFSFTPFDPSRVFAGDAKSPSQLPNTSASGEVAIVPVVIPETGYKVKQSKPTGERMKPKSSGTKSVPGGRPTRAAAHTKLPAAAEKPDEIKPETLAEPIAALRAFDANKDRIDQLKNDVLEVIDERWMEDTYKNPDLLTVTKADLVRLMKAAQPNNANVEIVADAHLRAIESARKPMVAEREALLARIAAAIATDRKDVIEAVFGIRSLGSTHAQEAAAALIPAALWAAQHGHGLTAPLLRDEPRSRFERVEQTNIALDVMFMQTRFRVSPGQGVSRRAVERANAALEIAPVSSMRNAPCLDLT